MCDRRAKSQESRSTNNPPRVSAGFWPVTVDQAGARGPSTAEVPQRRLEPVPRSPRRWGDWPRGQIRRHWLKVVRTETVEGPMGEEAPTHPPPPTDASLITRAQRAHWRFSWDERVPRTVRSSPSPTLHLTIHGLPSPFANAYGFVLARVAEALIAGFFLSPMMSSPSNTFSLMGISLSVRLACLRGLLFRLSAWFHLVAHPVGE